MKTTIATGDAQRGLTAGYVEVELWIDGVGRGRAVRVQWGVPHGLAITAAEARAIAFALNMYADAVTVP